MNDLLSILTTAEGQLRAASREAFKLSAARAAKGTTDEANLCAAAGVQFGDLANSVLSQATSLREGLRIRDQQQAAQAKEKEAARLLGAPILKLEGNR